MEYYGFLPFEGSRFLVINGDEIIDRLAELVRRGETCAAQSLPTQDAEPALDLIQPGRICWNEVEVDLGMAFEPSIFFRLVSAEIVEHNMDFAARMRVAELANLTKDNI